MEDVFDYKEEIRKHHKQGLGASDAQILSKADAFGYVAKSDYERLAVIKGFCEYSDIPTNEAMRMGDEIENKIFDMLHSQDERWESNKYIESVDYSRKNLKVFCHIDYFHRDDEKKVVTFVENKATNKDLKHARYTYESQLFLEYNLGREYVKSLGKGWKFNMKISHYNTNGYDGEIVPEKIERSSIRFSRTLFNIGHAMDIINTFMDGFTEYYKDVIDENYLPAEVKTKLDVINGYLLEIKKLERNIDEFKKRMYVFMKDKNITSIKTGEYTITKVDDGEIRKFDTKAFREKHNTLYTRFAKITKRNGYVLIKQKEGNEK